MKITWSHDHLIFIMEIPISEKTVFILKLGPDDDKLANGKRKLFWLNTGVSVMRGW